MSAAAFSARRWIGALAGVVLIALLATLATPAPAQSATTSPFSPGVPVAPVTTTTTAPTTVTTSGTSGNDGLSSSSALAIALGAVIVLSGISLFIWRDARRRAPVRHRAAGASADEGGSSRPGSKQRVKPRKLSPAERRRRKRGRAR